MSTEVKRQQLILILGVGNGSRRDDGVGLRVAELVRDAKPANAVVGFCTGEMTDLLHRWKGFEFVVLIDASQGTGQPGRLRRWESRDPALGSVFCRRSSHELGVAEAVGLARILGALPSKLVLFSVEGEDFSHGKGLSACVEEAAHRARRRILAEIAGDDRSASQA